MKVRALRNFSAARWGNVSIGQHLELSEHLARQMIADGLIEGLQIPEKKFFCETTASSLLEAGQVLAPNNAKSLTEQGQKANAVLSQLIPVLEPSTSTQSTDATVPGGDNTTPKRRGRPKSSQLTSGQR